MTAACRMSHSSMPSSSSCVPPPSLGAPLPALVLARSAAPMKDVSNAVDTECKDGRLTSTLVERLRVFLEPLFGLPDYEHNMSIIGEILDGT